MANLDTEQNRMIKRINEENEAREEAIGVVKKQLEENDREINSITVLKSELDSLIDANGRVKEGYEDRVNFISNELTEKTEWKSVSQMVLCPNTTNCLIN